jgi:hypothetical protein
MLIFDTSCPTQLTIKSEEHQSAAKFTKGSTLKTDTFIHSACAECHDSLPFSEASSIPLCYILFNVTLLHQLFFHPPSLNLAIYFLVYLLILLFPNSYIILFWEFYFLPFSLHAQTDVIYVTLLSLLWWVF